MIGFYDYTVVITYASLVSAVSGMFCVFTGHMHLAIFCLALSGLLDAFDGKVARTKPNRTEEEKKYGIQIDSLCDMVCFGALPVVICYHTGMSTLLGMAILAFYCLAGLIRLAYFNVMEEKRQEETTENRKYYQGLPITSISVILPLVYVSSSIFHEHYLIVLYVAMFITGFLFIKKFNFRKPTNKELIAIIIFVGLMVLFILIFYQKIGIFRWNWKSLAEPLEELDL